MRGLTIAALLLGAVGRTRASEPAIVADDLLADVRYLASPTLEGRGALTHGLDRAAEYVARRMAAAGLRPAGEDGTYFQAVEIPVARRAGAGTRLALGGTALSPETDFSPNAGSPASRAAGGLVFAGYGVVVPDRYDDFAGVDVRGKVVICLRYAPGYDERNGRLGEPVFREAAALHLKLENAIARGAVGLIVVDPPGAPARPGTGGETGPLSFLAAQSASSIASFHARAAAIDPVLAAGGETLAALRDRIDATGRPASFEVPAWAELAVEWMTPAVRGRNVVAVLEGSEPALREEAVLVGAHYDHLGRGDEGSVLDGRAIHPGADDNASGTAALLEIAEQLAAASPRPRRSVIFAAFTAEEKGLLGSTAAAAHTGRSLVAMLNLDMVGRLRGGALEVGGSATAPEWQAIVEAANSDKLSLSFPRLLVPNSDHAPFVSRNVPALFFFTGMHGDYHRVTDTWEKVNVDGAAKVARLAARVARAVADRPQRLAFAAPQWARGGALGAAHGAAVRLGIRPDTAATNGLGVAEVLPGGTAAAAGLQPGDVIERIGDKPVTDVDAYMEALAPFKPGDSAVLRVRRQASTMTVTVTFRGPGRP